MIIGPKYKIARRLGATVFEKTQTQKYQLSLARKEKNKTRGFSRPKSEFGIQLLEKQKARYSYCLTEKQFSKYVKVALSNKDKSATSKLFATLELRADTVAYKAGFAPTLLAARQMIGHGHMLVNSKRITIPSYRLAMGDTISIRSVSAGKALFATLDERLKGKEVPAWIKFDFDKKSATVQGEPKYDGLKTLFDLNVVLEFYSR